MKTKQLTIGFHESKLEALIVKRKAELNSLAVSDARHYAKSHRPMATGDKLEPYTGKIRSGYEQLLSEARLYLQPDSIAPSAQIETHYYEEKSKELDSELKEKSAQTNNLENDLKNYNPGNVPLLLFVALLCSFIIFLGEVYFNSTAFQQWGDNQLTAFLFSVAISLGVLIDAHTTAHYVKRFEKRWQKVLLMTSSYLIVTIPFSVIAHLRTQVLLAENIATNPSDFVLVNLFLYTITLMVSLFIMPDIDDIKDHLSKWRMHRKVVTGRREEEKMKKKKGEMMDNITQKTMDRINLGYYAMDTSKRINKMYKESVELFKSTNLSLRTDGKTPDCFIKDVPNLDDDFNFNFNTKLK